MRSLLSILRLKCLSAFGFWGTGGITAKTDDRTRCLKCLSAFGFWGTRPSAKCGDPPNPVSNAFRLLGSGELNFTKRRCQQSSTGLKCLSAFGFWGTYGPAPEVSGCFRRSQMPFGFWVLGNLEAGQSAIRDAILSQMPFGFWVLGNRHKINCDRIQLDGSQMPFGFWVLGNAQCLVMLLVEQSIGLKCLSAFGFWGTRRNYQRQL